MNNNKNTKGLLGQLYTWIALFTILGTFSWYGYYLFTGRKAIETNFQSGFPELEKLALSKKLPELKEAVHLLFTKLPELKAFSLVDQEGVIYVSSRLKNLVPPAPQVQNPLLPLYLPEFPWEDVKTISLGKGVNKLIIQYYFTTLNPLHLVEILKNVIFFLLGLLLISLIVGLATKEDSEQDEEEDSDYYSREPEAPTSTSLNNDEDSFFDIPQLDDIDLSQHTALESEEFWFKEDDSEEPHGSFTTPAVQQAPTNIEVDQPPYHESTPVGNLTLFDPKTGGVWEEFFIPRLESELQRAADHNQDLVLAFISSESPLTPKNLVSLNLLLQGSFPLKDLIFNRKDMGFSVILPQRTLPVAIKDLSLIYKRQEIANLPSRIIIGLSSRSGRLLDASTLLQEAEKALEKAKVGHESIIGFRADPDRYRNHLAQLS